MALIGVDHICIIHLWFKICKTNKFPSKRCEREAAAEKDVFGIGRSLDSQND